MSTIEYFRFALALPKRHYVYHWLYRRMFRIYAKFVRATNPKLTIDEFLFGAVALPISIMIILFTIITIAVS